MRYPLLRIVYMYNPQQGVTQRYTVILLVAVVCRPHTIISVLDRQSSWWGGDVGTTVCCGLSRADTRPPIRYPRQWIITAPFHPPPQPPPPPALRTSNCVILGGKLSLIACLFHMTRCPHPRITSRPNVWKNSVITRAKIMYLNFVHYYLELAVWPSEFRRIADG